jgi:hypothetical protein
VQRPLECPLEGRLLHDHEDAASPCLHP